MLTRAGDDIPVTTVTDRPPGPAHSRRRNGLPTELIECLGATFGSRFTMSAAVCLHHGTDESAFEPVPPDAVVFPESTEEVAKVVAACSAWRIPVIAYGAGSSIEGHLLAVEGGVCIDMSRMDKVTDIRAEDLTATAQAGVTREALNRELAQTGFFFSVDMHKHIIHGKHFI